MKWRHEQLNLEVILSTMPTYNGPGLATTKAHFGQKPNLGLDRQAAAQLHRTGRSWIAQQPPTAKVRWAGLFRRSLQVHDPWLRIRSIW